MKHGYLEFVFRLQCIIAREDGQDLVEYALVLGVLAAAVTASTKSFAVLLTTVLSTIATAFTNALS